MNRFINKSFLPSIPNGETPLSRGVTVLAKVDWTKSPPVDLQASYATDDEVFVLQLTAFGGYRTLVADTESAQLVFP